MNNLWKKEATRSGVSYVDLFASVPESEWNDRELVEVMDYLDSYCSVKDNQKATAFRVRGNDEFRMKNWANAMRLYNHCLCFAEVGSDEAAMAYANRSACFFHMQKYDEVLVDIELAKSANISDRLLTKLEQRKQKSLELMGNNEPPVKHVMKLSYPANKNFPCLANVVDIKQSNEYGRHLVATQDIPVGKIVLFEKDFVAMRKDHDLVCETCFREKANFIACENCSDVVFCSIECINQNMFHKWECGSVPRTMPNDDYNIFYERMRFQIRLLFVALETFGNVKHLVEFVDSALNENPDHIPSSLGDARSNYHFFFKLKASVPRGDISEARALFCKQYKGIQSVPKINALFDSNDKQRFLMHLVLKHLLLTQVNSIGNEVTKSMANVLSMLNHSCDPNIATLYIGCHQCCITVRPIKKGDQMFICYLQNKLEPLEERQDRFINKWNFICKCDRCIKTPETRESESIKSDSRFGFVLFNDQKKGKSSIVIDYCVQLLNTYGQHPWSLCRERVTHIYTSILLDQINQNL